MIPVYQHPYVDMTYDSSNDMLIDIWKEESIKMDLEEFKEFLFAWRALAIKHNVKLALSDVTKMGFTLSVDIYAWIAEHITGVAAKEASLKAQAMILPEGFMQNISIQLYSDGSKQDGRIKNEYFESQEAGKKWLLSLAKEMV